MDNSHVIEDDLGTIHGISSSGSGWGQGITGNIREMFFNTLQPENVRELVQISTFSLGNKNEEVEEFFKIIHDLLRNERNVILIVNDNEDEKNPTCSKFAKKKIRELKKWRPDRLQYRLFKSRSDHAGKILHAKIIVIDRTIALVGSANISSSALVSNYEIMLKLSGPAARSMSMMLDNLLEMLEKDPNEK